MFVINWILKKSASRRIPGFPGISVFVFQIPTTSIHKRMLLFLWIVFLLANIVAQNTETQICDEIYQKTEDVWLIGEAPETSFASQYLAILAYIPTAIVLKSYLVVSDLAVHEAVRENGAIISWKKSSSAFSSFFAFRFILGKTSNESNFVFNLSKLFLNRCSFWKNITGPNSSILTPCCRIISNPWISSLY